MIFPLVELVALCGETVVVVVVVVSLYQAHFVDVSANGILLLPSQAQLKDCINLLYEKISKS